MGDYYLKEIDIALLFFALKGKSLRDGVFKNSSGSESWNRGVAAFAEFLDETALDSRQIYFVNQIVEYIVHNGMMKELSVLQETPFTDQGSIVELFTDLSVWMGIRKAIESVNANAVAA